MLQGKTFYNFSVISVTLELVWPARCSFPLSDPEAGGEEEAGGGLGQEEDRVDLLNLYVWIHQETAVGTRQQ